MRIKKARKPRGIKLNGRHSMDMCEGCLSFGCDPMADSRQWALKKHRRYVAGQCPSCGQPKEQCACKSSLSAKPEPICTACGEYIMGRVYQMWSRQGIKHYHKKCLPGKVVK